MWNKDTKKENYTVEDISIVNGELKNNILSDMDFVKEQMSNVNYISNLCCIKHRLENTLNRVKAMLILSESVVDIDKFLKEFSKGE